jgi:aspartate kinase
MFHALADAGVNIEMISTSEIRITTIIAEDSLETAVQALHKAFELERPESAALDAASTPSLTGTTAAR